jgi:4-oxalocrotonate tautomerase
MPHVIVKLYPGRPEEKKRALAARINQAVIEALDVPDEAVSVALEEISKDAWETTVKNVDIIPKQATIYKHSKSSKTT